MTSSARILIFDSGVGGLSILAEIRAQHPQCSLFYASDNAAFPYGPKAEADLVERVDQVLHKLQQSIQPDIIVVACNTASTLALPRIRSRFSIPVVGVVPAIKPAAQVSESKTIGLLATPGTVARRYTQQLIEDFAKGCQVLPLGSSELVSLAEQKLRQKPIDINQLTAAVEPFINVEAMDTVVLACTHFPLIKKELQGVLKQVSHWVDSGDAIARRVGYWLEERQLLNEAGNPSYACFFTAKDDLALELESTLKDWALGDIHYLPIPYQTAAQ